MPMRRRDVELVPVDEHRLRMASSTFCATVAAARRSFRSVRRIVNSSPPMRATVSSARTQRDEPRCHCLQQAVADGVAEGVVHELELIEVEEHHRGAALDAASRAPARCRCGRGRAAGSAGRSGRRGTPDTPSAPARVLRSVMSTIVPSMTPSSSSGHVLEDPDLRAVAPAHARLDVRQRPLLAQAAQHVRSRSSSA